MNDEAPCSLICPLCRTDGTPESLRHDSLPQGIAQPSAFDRLVIHPTLLEAR